VSLLRAEGHEQWRQEALKHQAFVDSLSGATSRTFTENGAFSASVTPWGTTQPEKAAAARRASQRVSSAPAASSRTHARSVQPMLEASLNAEDDPTNRGIVALLLNPPPSASSPTERGSNRRPATASSVQTAIAYDARQLHAAQAGPPRLRLAPPPTPNSSLVSRSVNPGASAPAPASPPLYEDAAEQGPPTADAPSRPHTALELRLPHADWAELEDRVAAGLLVEAEEAGWPSAAAGPGGEELVGSPTARDRLRLDALRPTTSGGDSPGGGAVGWPPSRPATRHVRPATTSGDSGGRGTSPPSPGGAAVGVATWPWGAAGDEPRRLRTSGSLQALARGPRPSLVAGHASIPAGGAALAPVPRGGSWGTQPRRTSGAFNLVCETAPLAARHGKTAFATGLIHTGAFGAARARATVAREMRSTQLVREMRVDPNTSAAELRAGTATKAARRYVTQQPLCAATEGAGRRHQIY